MNASTQGDLDGPSQIAVFQPGVSFQSCNFIIQNDDTPEINETFVVQLVLSGSGSTGLVVSPSVAYLTILANDDAFGIIGFNEVRKVGYMYVTVFYM